MQIIIPMTGFGSRFVAAGYKEIKPFIRPLFKLAYNKEMLGAYGAQNRSVCGIHEDLSTGVTTQLPLEVEFGRPILKWIVDKIYPGESNFLFIIRDSQLDARPSMIDELKEIAPSCQVFVIKNWEKLGPVCDVLKASELIDEGCPVIVNYCDFYMRWDWLKFKDSVLSKGYSGAIPCYTGFHPHLIPKKNVYASCLVDENQCLIEIREKHSFQEDKTKGLHSAGAYYFGSGAIMKHYFAELMRQKIMLNGEYYASLPYNLMVQDGLKVWVPGNVEYFCQWGTPEDLEESVFWMDLISRARK